MSKILADMLSKPEELVSQAIAKLESKAGYPSQDVRTLAKIRQDVRAKIAQLGLDPDDTTPQELYHSLLARYASDCEHLDKSLGLEADAAFGDRVAKAVSLAEHMLAGSASWSLKASVAKRLLKELPPKKLMKALSYRSIDSMLKHESVAGLFIGAKLCQSSTWQKKMETKISHLSSTDFEMRPIQIVNLSKHQNLPSTSLTISSLEVGAVALCAERNSPAYTTLALVLALVNDASSLAMQHGHKSLNYINPSLSWWVGAEHLVAWNDGHPVSLNVLDAAINHAQDASFESRTTEHASQSLWAHLVDGYKQHIEELPETLTEIDSQAEDKLRRLVAPAAEMAEEYVEA